MKIFFPNMVKILHADFYMMNEVCTNFQKIPWTKFSEHAQPKSHLKTDKQANSNKNLSPPPPKLIYFTIISHTKISTYFGFLQYMYFFRKLYVITFFIAVRRIGHESTQHPTTIRDMKQSFCHFCNRQKGRQLCLGYTEYIGHLLQIYQALKQLRTLLVKFSFWLSDLQIHKGNASILQRQNQKPTSKLMVHISDLHQHWMNRLSTVPIRQHTGVELSILGNICFRST